MYRFKFGNSTHVGQIRKANEDYFGNFNTPNGHVFVVCDGMGGHVGGAKASRIAVESIKGFLETNSFKDPREAIHKSIVHANSSILDYGELHSEFQGMGSTCVMALISEKGVFIGHVGDSRIYLLSGSEMNRLTKDHSYVQGLVDLGEITEEQAEQHPRKNEISNALGLKNMKPPTVYPKAIPLERNDILLLCTDGLTGMVNDQKILKVLSSGESIQEKSDKLVEIANRAGGTDNITVQLISFPDAPPKVDEKKAGEKNGFPLLLYIIVGILLIAGGYGLREWLGSGKNTRSIKTNVEKQLQQKKHSANDDVNLSGQEDPISSDSEEGSGILPVGSESREEENNHQSGEITSLVNNGAQAWWRLKNLEKELRAGDSLIIGLKDLMKDTEANPDSMLELAGSVVDEKGKVWIQYRNKNQEMIIIPDSMANGKTKLKFWFVKKNKVVSDTANLSITIIPEVRLVPISLEVNHSQTTIALIDLIQNQGKNHIPGYDPEKLYFEIIHSPEWMKTDMENRLLYLEQERDTGSFTFRYRILSEKEIIGEGEMFVHSVLK